MHENIALHVTDGDFKICNTVKGKYDLETHQMPIAFSFFGVLPVETKRDQEILKNNSGPVEF